MGVNHINRLIWTLEPNVGKIFGWNINNVWQTLTIALSSLFFYILCGSMSNHIEQFFIFCMFCKKNIIQFGLHVSQSKAKFEPNTFLLR
jgi:hypothetical protein